MGNARNGFVKIVTNCLALFTSSQNLSVFGLLERKGGVQAAGGDVAAVNWECCIKKAAKVATWSALSLSF